MAFSHPNWTGLTRFGPSRTKEMLEAFAELIYNVGHRDKWFLIATLVGVKTLRSYSIVVCVHLVAHILECI